MIRQRTLLIKQQQTMITNSLLLRRCSSPRRLQSVSLLTDLADYWCDLLRLADGGLLRERSYWAIQADIALLIASEIHAISVIFVRVYRAFKQQARERICEDSLLAFIESIDGVLVRSYGDSVSFISRCRELRSTEEVC